MEKVLKELLRGRYFSGVSKDRSRMMRTVRWKNNKGTEQRFRMALVRASIGGWKLHTRSITGTPDFYFPKRRAAIFIDGCFWHGCKECGHIPKTRSAFWAAKINGNMKRDKRNTRLLRKQSVKVFRVWEHSLKTSEQVKHAVSELRKAIRH